MGADAITPEVLLRHAGGLRRLARGILGDADAAEDVVQETWLRALRRPPPSTERLGGWLRSVARSSALQRLRGESRRGRRERAAARPEAVAGHAELAARAEVLRAVVAAVLALDEPYREAVLLRHFEGLPPREIARRAGVSVAAVDSRLQRAHRRLRAVLERELGADRERWLPALAGFAGPSSLGLTALVGGGSVAKGALAASLTAAALAAWLLVRAPDGETAPLAASPARTERSEAALAAATVEPRPVGREAVDSQAALDTAPPDEVTTAAASAPGFPELRVLVVDERDEPVAGARVLVGPRRHPLNLAGATGADGVLELRRGAAPRVELVVAAEQGKLASDLARAPGWRRGELLVLRLHGSSAPDVLRRQGRPEVTPEGFVDPWIARRLDPPPPLALEVEELRVLKTLEQIAQLGYVTVNEGAPPQPVVRGTVRDEQGEPVARARVRAEGPQGSVSSGRADEQGGYALTLPGAGDYLVAAGERGEGEPQPLRARDGEQLALDLLARPGPPLLVALEDGRGEPLAGWLVEVWGERAGEPFARQVRSDAQGHARISGAGELRVELLARPDSRVSHVRTGSLAGLGALGGPLPPPLELLWRGHQDGARRMVARTTPVLGHLEVEVVDHDGTPVTGAEVRLWRDDCERGVWMPGDGKGLWRLPDVAMGRYELEVGALERRWTRAGFLHPGDGGHRERVVLEAPAQLELVVADEGARRVELQLERIGPEPPSRSPAVRLELPLRLQVPAGAWRVRVDGAALAQPAVLAPGGHARLALQ